MALKFPKHVFSQQINPRNHRLSLPGSPVSQAMYWGQYGVAQSCGARYELHCDSSLCSDSVLIHPERQTSRIPDPVRILMALHSLGYVTDKQLAEVRTSLNSYDLLKKPIREKLQK